MKMKHTEDYINELLAKYIGAEPLSEQEKTDIQDWIASHTQEYNRLVKLISPQKPPEFDAAKAWQRVEQHIENNAGQNKGKIFSMNASKKKSIGMSVFYVAASVLIIMVLSVSFFLRSWNTEEWMYANNTAMKETVYLPDSSTVILYPNSALSYKSDASYSSREVGLKGKAFFDVRKMHGKPFRIQSECIKVEVLGTSFLVDATKSASAGVYVKTGVVRVESESSEVVIKANQKAELVRDVLKTGNIDNPFQVFEERPKILSFTNRPITEVAREIEEMAGLKIEVEKNLQNNKITTQISLENAEAIVEELAFLCNCKYEVIEAGTHYRLY